MPGTTHVALDDHRHHAHDEATTNGQVSLREAIAAANTDASVDGSVAGDAGVTNKIVFAPA